MAGITIKVDAAKCLSALEVLASKQIPFATATALNDLAFQVQRAEQAGIQSTFKNPRPFTVKPVFVTKASKANPIATVYVRPEVAKYLQPYETGGAHVLPGRALLNPKDITLDQYGQLPKGTMAKLAARPDIYIGTVNTKAGPVNGVWQRLQVTRSGNVRRKSQRGSLHDAELGRLKLLVRFGNALPVKQHLGFQDRGLSLVRAGFSDAFARAMDKALATAR